MNRGVIFLSCILTLYTVSGAQGAEEKQSDPHEYTITRVVDGDTVEFILPGLPRELGDTLKLRVLGVDTPEKGGRAKCEREAQLGEKATEFSKKAVSSAVVKEIVLKEWDKFGGRVLGDVLLDGRSLSKMLIEAKLARPYFGEKKQSWCE